MVDKTIHFFGKTIPAAKLGGPFSEKQLQLMFEEAHYCGDLPLLPPAYSRVVEQLQEIFIVNLIWSQEFLKVLGYFI